jgi:hypothetical protein
VSVPSTPCSSSEACVACDACDVNPRVSVSPSSHDQVLGGCDGKLLCVSCWLSVPQGKPSRSLQAAFKLIDEAGLTADDVVHMERGVYGWYQSELPMVGECTAVLTWEVQPGGCQGASSKRWELGSFGAPNNVQLIVRLVAVTF